MVTVGDLIDRLADEHQAMLVRDNSDERIYTVRLQRADNAPSTYRIAAEVSGARVRAREDPAARLPESCPERHINRGGWFCMNWEKGEPLDVVDEETARSWWQTLLAYLNLQDRAERLRRWPSTSAWAHGDAAIHQRRAEECASALGSGFRQALDMGRLSVRRRKASGGNFLAVVDRGKVLYSVWEREARAATLRQRCICGLTPLPLRRCADHKRHAAGLALAIRDWRQAEERFWQGYADQECCGSFDVCPLRTMGTAKSKAALASAA